jgi:hypothetical protein
MSIGVEMQMNGVPPRGTCSLLEWEPSHGIARGNLQLPCLPRRSNTWPLLVNAPSIGNNLKTSKKCNTQGS